MVLPEYLFNSFALDEDCLKNADGARSTTTTTSAAGGYSWHILWGVR